MTGSIFVVLQWAKKEGEVKVLDRIRIRVLPDTMREKIRISSVQRSTTCSPALLNKIRKVASDVVGKRCPV